MVFVGTWKCYRLMSWIDAVTSEVEWLVPVELFTIAPSVTL
jgi:hypothetical protein